MQQDIALHTISNPYWRFDAYSSNVNDLEFNGLAITNTQCAGNARTNHHEVVPRGHHDRGRSQGNAIGRKRSTLHNSRFVGIRWRQNAYLEGSWKHVVEFL